MKKLSYQNSYVKYPGTSCRDDENKPRKKKESQFHIGKVIDEKQNIFFNPKVGLFVYDPSTEECYRTKNFSFSGYPSLTFGDSYFLDKLLKEKSMYDSVLKQIPCHNKDTLYAMVHYHILCDDVNVKAEDWFQGSFAHFLYPKAKLSDKDIEGCLKSLGQRKRAKSFFDAHIDWGSFRDKEDIVLTGRYTAPSGIDNHDKNTTKKVKMMVLTQKSTGYPVLLCNIADKKDYLSAVLKAKYRLSLFGMELSYAIINDDRNKEENGQILHKKGIQFIVRMSPENEYYGKIITLGKPKLKENLVQYRGRMAYVYRAQFKSKGVYAYLCCYSDDAAQNVALGKDAENQAGADDPNGNTDSGKPFVLVSTNPFKKREVLPAYYPAEQFQQYFDTNSESSKFSLMSKRYEGEALYGHLILSMIAATINQYIKNKYLIRWEGANPEGESVEGIFKKLRKQKCALVNSMIINTDIQDDILELYKKFGIKFPLFFKQSNISDVNDINCPWEQKNFCDRWTVSMPPPFPTTEKEGNCDTGKQHGICK